MNQALAIHQKHNAVPLDHLLSPLITLGYEFPPSERRNAHDTGEGVIGFYDGKGDTIEEFKYISNYSSNTRLQMGLEISQFAFLNLIATPRPSSSGQNQILSETTGL